MIEKQVKLLWDAICFYSQA